MFSTKFTRAGGKLLSAALLLALIAPSCNRKKDDNNIISPENTGYAEEQLILEQLYDNADRVLERAMTLGSASLKGAEQPLSFCAEVKFDTTEDANIDRLTIDFGGTDCMGWDGRNRRGRLIIDYSKYAKKLSDAGHYHKIVFDNYQVDGYRLGGHRELWNKGANNAGNMALDIASVDTIYLKDNSGKVTGASQRTREFYAGATTPQAADDIYRITGFGNFIRPNGEKYYVEIAKPLIDAMSCSWINEGVINIYPENATQRVIDFGKGDCENDATININGSVRDVKIP